MLSPNVACILDCTCVYSQVHMLYKLIIALKAVPQQKENVELIF